MAKICGLEDAGRGPVIGPMVLAGVVIEEKNIDKLREINVKDSKLLTPNKREELYGLILDIVDGYKVEIIEPKEIDKAIDEYEGSNLNWLEAERFASIINYLKPDRVIVDCPSPNLKAYLEYMRRFVKVKTHIQCEHKADVRYVIVGAASIIAKVTRDKEIEKIKKKIGKQFRSGYPSDKVTQEFLKKYWNKYPEIFRHSWASYKKVAGLKKQKTLEEF